MGYETQFTIDAARVNEGPSFTELRAKAKAWEAIEDKSVFTAKHRAEMERYVAACSLLTGNQWADLDYIWDGQAGKFYQWRDTFRALSAAFPDFVFRVEWAGEESGDHGHAEFRKGKAREAKAMLPPLPEEWT